MPLILSLAERQGVPGPKRFPDRFGLELQVCVCSCSSENDTHPFSYPALHCDSTW